ncbi:hypothetical protein D3C80_2048060 [compost metagenome]
MYVIALLLQLFSKLLHPLLVITFKRMPKYRLLPMNKLQVLSDLLLVKRSVQREHTIQTADDKRCSNHYEKSDKPPRFVGMR